MKEAASLSKLAAHDLKNANVIQYVIMLCLDLGRFFIETPVHINV